MDGGARGVSAEAGRRGGLPLARGGRLAHRRVLRCCLRVRGNTPGGLFRGPQDLRRAARDHAWIRRVRDLLLPSSHSVVRALQVLQALRPEGLLDRGLERGAALPRSHVRLPLEVPLYLADRGAVRLCRERDDRSVPVPAVTGHLRCRLRRHPARIRTDVPAGLLAARHPGTRRTRAVGDARGDPELPPEHLGRACLGGHRRTRWGWMDLLGRVRLLAGLPTAGDQRSRYGHPQEEGELVPKSSQRRRRRRIVTAGLAVGSNVPDCPRLTGLPIGMTMLLGIWSNHDEPGSGTGRRTSCWR